MDGRRSAKLTEAQDQLAEWRKQLDNPANRQLLGEMYNFPRRWTFEYNLVPRLIDLWSPRRVQIAPVAEPKAASDKRPSYGSDDF